MSIEGIQPQVQQAVEQGTISQQEGDYVEFTAESTENANAALSVFQQIETDGEEGFSKEELSSASERLSNLQGKEKDALDYITALYGSYNDGSSRVGSGQTAESEVEALYNNLNFYSNETQADGKITEHELNEYVSFWSNQLGGEEIAEEAPAEDETQTTEAPEATETPAEEAPAEDETQTTEAPVKDTSSGLKITVGEADETTPGAMKLDMTTDYIYNHDGNGASRSFGEVKDALAGDIAQGLGFINENSTPEEKQAAIQEHAQEIEDTCRGILEANGQTIADDASALEALVKIGNDGYAGNDKLYFTLQVEQPQAQLNDVPPAEEAPAEKAPAAAEPTPQEALTDAQETFADTVQNGNLKEIEAAAKELEAAIAAEIDTKDDTGVKTRIDEETGTVMQVFEDGTTVELVKDENGDYVRDNLTYSGLDGSTKDAIQYAAEKREAIEDIKADLKYKHDNGVTVDKSVEGADDIGFVYSTNDKGQPTATRQYSDGTVEVQVNINGEWEIDPEQYVPGSVHEGSPSPKTGGEGVQKTPDETLADFNSAKEALQKAQSEFDEIPNRVNENKYNKAQEQFQSAAEADLTARLAADGITVDELTENFPEDKDTYKAVLTDGTEATFAKQEDGSWKLDASSYNPAQAQTETDQALSIGVSANDIISAANEKLENLDQFDFAKLSETEFEYVVNNLPQSAIDYIYNNLGPFSANQNKFLEHKGAQRYED